MILKKKMESRGSSAFKKCNMATESVPDTRDEHVRVTLAYASLLAHLSRRLTGELIVYPCSGVRPSSSVRRPSSTISKIFSSETAWPMKAKLHVDYP